MGFTEVECVKRMGLGFDALDRVLQLCAPEAPSQLGEQKQLNPMRFLQPFGEGSRGSSSGV